MDMQELLKGETMNESQLKRVILLFALLVIVYVISTFFIIPAWRAEQEQQRMTYPYKFFEEYHESN